MLSHKASKENWNYKISFFYHNGKKLETKNRKTTEKFANTDLKQHTAEQPVGQKRNQKVNKKVSWDKQKWKHNVPEIMWCSKNSSKRED